MVKISPAPRRQRRSEGEERKCGHGEVGKNGGGASQERRRQVERLGREKNGI